MKKTPLVKTSKQRIEELEKTVKTLMDWYVSRQKHNLDKVVAYTAMRSTGEDYCTCKNRRSVTTGTHDPRRLCGECGLEVKPIKPQEDVREKLAIYLFNKDWGNQKNVTWDVQPDLFRRGFYKEADRILAIVKGE